MSIFADIPVTLDYDRISARLAIEQGSPEENEFKLIATAASKYAAPKALIRHIQIEHWSEDCIIAAGVEFNSRIVADKSRKDGFVIMFAATCGRELNEVKIAEDDFLGAYWLEVLKEEYLTQAVSFLRQYVLDKYNFVKCVEFCPSDSGFWELTELKKVFSVLGGDTAEIGIELGEYCFMTPGKSVSGVLLNVHDDFCSCDICDLRNKCNRKGDHQSECRN
jgi:hypothetical protein